MLFSQICKIDPFVRNEEGLRFCKHCLRSIDDDISDKVVRSCLAFPIHSSIEIAKSFLTEWSIWKKRGSPIRPIEHIKHLYYEHCKRCSLFEPHLKKDEGKCKLCTCRLSPKNDGLNKIAWATTRCPKPTPEWIQEKPFQDLAKRKCCGQ